MKQLTGLLAIAFVVACGDGTNGQNGAPNNEAPNIQQNNAEGVTYYQDLKPLFDAHCTTCHVEGGIGPFPLTTYEDVSAVAALVASVVESRQMPPIPAAPAVRPFQFDMSLSDAQIALVKDWVDGGALEGDVANPAAPIEVETRKLSNVDLTLGIPEPYTPTVFPDEYRCFILDWPETETKFITGFDVVPDNLAVAHHAAVYLIDESEAAAIDAADGEDGSPGYECFGGPSPNGQDQIPARLLGGWAPGTEGGDLPEGTGPIIQPGTRVVLQLHYSIVEEGPQPDQTQVQFSIADTVSKNAGYLPFFNIEWVSNRESMLIPAGAAEVSHEFVGNPGQWPLFGEFLAGVDPSEGLMIHGVGPHLHKLGTKFSLQVERADGTVEPLIHIDRYDFDWQLTYDFEEPVFVGPDDELRLQCEWDNSMSNQPTIDGGRRTPEDVTWGEGTFDEMCVAPIYVTGVAEGSEDCAEVGSIPSDTGRFELSFDALVRGNPNIEGELLAPVEGSIYRADDVTLMGPKEGTEPVATFSFDEIDLREGPDGPFLIDVELPAGNYQVLGFMDTDGNADTTGGPDLNDPIMIPAQPFALSCERQPITAQFAILLPDL